VWGPHRSVEALRVVAGAALAADFDALAGDRAQQRQHLCTVGRRQVPIRRIIASQQPILRPIDSRESKEREKKESFFFFFFPFPKSTHHTTHTFLSHCKNQKVSHK
jgi:hypothetical protein